MSLIYFQSWGSTWKRWVFIFNLCFLLSFFTNSNENKTEKEIKTDIDNCLSYIDNGNIDFLNQIWKIN